MALLNVLGNLEKVYDLATSDVPDAIDRAAEMAHGFELAMKGFAVWLRNLKDGKVQSASPDQDAEVDSRTAALVTKCSSSLHDNKLMQAGPNESSPESWLIIILKVAELIQKWRNR
jgi:hypothetical protein